MFGYYKALLGKMFMKYNILIIIDFFVIHFVMRILLGFIENYLTFFYFRFFLTKKLRIFMCDCMLV